MKSYANRGGNSNVRSYESGSTYIAVWFNGSSKAYTYSYGKAGKHHVETMKKLAVQGSGLNSYINRNVKKAYD